MLLLLLFVYRWCRLHVCLELAPLPADGRFWETRYRLPLYVYRGIQLILSWVGHTVVESSQPNLLISEVHHLLAWQLSTCYGGCLCTSLVVREHAWHEVGSGLLVNQFQRLSSSDASGRWSFLLETALLGNGHLHAVTGDFTCSYQIRLTEGSMDSLLLGWRHIRCWQLLLSKGTVHGRHVTQVGHWRRTAHRSSLLIQGLLINGNVPMKIGEGFSATVRWSFIRRVGLLHLLGVDIAYCLLALCVLVSGVVIQLLNLVFLRLGLFLFYFLHLPLRWEVETATLLIYELL